MIGLTFSYTVFHACQVPAHFSVFVSLLSTEGFSPNNLSHPIDAAHTRSLLNRTSLLHLTMMKLPHTLLWLAATTVSGYEITSAGEMSLTDSDTGISGILTVFTDEPIMVTLDGLEWGEDMNVTTLSWEVFIEGKSVLQDSMELDGEDLPSSLEAGEVYVKDRGMTNFRVELTSGESSADTSLDLPAFGNGVAIIPLLVVLGLAMTTKMVSVRPTIHACRRSRLQPTLFVLIPQFVYSSHQVEFSLLSAIFVGACMVAGEINLGFKNTLEVYLLEAVADIGHGYVILFSLFLSYVVVLSTP